MATRQLVLVDTNTIIECYRTGCWSALAGAWPLETVEECIVETQTGALNRSANQQIDEASLRKSFVRINAPTPLQLAGEIFLRPPYLDLGERHLWAHAIDRTDAWMLCGPDRASMKFGVVNNMRDRLVSLERLLTEAGFRPRLPLKAHFEDSWLRQIISQHLFDGPPGRRP